MKHALSTIISILLAFSASAQTSSQASFQASSESQAVSLLARISQQASPAYRLYPTENMWLFLELDTTTGRIWQLKYSTNIKSDLNKDTTVSRIKVILNADSLILASDTLGAYPGRFELYKTENMFNFILLDTATGSTWQVHWGNDAKSRLILPIL